MHNTLYDDWIKPLGEEYPTAISIQGTRIPLAYESRFTRHYLEIKSDVGCHTGVSRFLDGTASITLQQLKEEWSGWNDADRADFCASMPDLQNIGQEDFAQIVRFLLDNADVNILGQVVLGLPRWQTFPPDETFRLLIEVLQRSSQGRTADVIRALGLTKHPEAEATIRRHLAGIVADPNTWVDADFFNNRAQDLAFCILSLVKLGAPPVDFVEIVRRLTEHACDRNREWCRRNFAKHYPGLGGTSGRNRQ
jgi:hypothetical protein